MHLYVKLVTHKYRHTLAVLKLCSVGLGVQQK